MFDEIIHTSQWRDWTKCANTVEWIRNVDTPANIYMKEGKEERCTIDPLYLYYIKRHPNASILSTDKSYRTHCFTWKLHRISNWILVEGLYFMRECSWVRFCVFSIQSVTFFSFDTQGDIGRKPLHKEQPTGTKNSVLIHCSPHLEFWMTYTFEMVV